MGIELELHSRRPARKGSSADTLLRASYQHGEALARVLGALDGHRSGGRGTHRSGALDALDRHSSGGLRRVDPYGDTFFGEHEARAARDEAVALARRCADERRRAALLDLAELLEACATTPGSYLWCRGD
ncbi:hypothetical protein [Streptomyces sp. A012304]|uniref:hypothetical protein n=1 Tax=Streptomyces sp. A012304 TaxID=375446 RepID=UPI0022305C75|nr:hypothetical protein [Streptomyces sp. A012304]GKQ40208.1 hypothetical protein ALMP_67340 [Streptomyces sp. A012304]